MPPPHLPRHLLLPLLLLLLLPTSRPSSPSASWPFILATLARRIEVWESGEKRGENSSIGGFFSSRRRGISQKNKTLNLLSLPSPSTPRPAPPPAGLQWQPPSQTAAAEAAAAAASEAGTPPPPLYRPPVENVLERALALSGAVTESNAGNPAKVGWTRSSRTDAGVHSLSTIVSLRAECVPEAFERTGDPEGLEFARGVNEHLPDDVRVFSAQRVNGGWCARGMCEAREYEYTLPARILLPARRPGKGAEGGEEESDDLEAAVRRLEEVLSLYVGQRPFHNFTVRREYRAEAASGSGGSRRGEKAREGSRRQRLGRRQEGSSSADAPRSSDGGREGEEEDEGAAASSSSPPSLSAPPPSFAPASSPSASASFSFSAGGPCGSRRQASTSTSSPAEGEEQPRLPFFVRPLWLEEPPSGDKVGPAHWRRIDSARIVFPERGAERGGEGRGASGGGDTAAAPAALPLVPGGEPALTVRISGGSFMLRQLRHMIGAAVAVARGSLPSAAVVAAALRVPARLSLPLAPPHTLVLTGARFGAYPAKALATGDVAPWAGDRLELRSGGERAAREFRRARLDAALDALLRHEDWGLWAEQLDRLRWDDAEIAGFVAKAEADARAAEERAREREERRGGGGGGGDEGGEGAEAGEGQPL